MVKTIFRQFGWILSAIFPFKLTVKAIAIKNYIYTGYLSSQFKHIGSNPYIQFPMTLIGGGSIEIGSNFHTYPRTRLEAHVRHMNDYYAPEIVIGNNVAINFDCHIACINQVRIGNDVLIASKVFITDHYHGRTDSSFILSPPNLRKLHSPGPVIIEDNVWVGEGVSIMPNVTIGKNCIIGANSVITKSVPSNSIVAGVPAKVLNTIML